MLLSFDVAVQAQLEHDDWHSHAGVPWFPVDSQTQV